MYKKVFKRTLDIILSVLAIICLSPLLALIALLVKINLGSPILFKQPRPGKNEKIFYLYKFRSMSNATDKNGKLLPDKERLTKFGKFLRKSSIDELPELFNILKGDMSIVGPRPLSMYYLQYLNTKEKRRHELRPGLTGLAQINGRNNISWDQKYQYDIDYINNISFKTDLNIIYNTFLKVIKGSGVAVNDGINILKNFTSYRIVTEEREIIKMKNETSYGEIGSYFWYQPTNDQNNNLSWLPITLDSSFTYSGRNAIGCAIEDILRNKKIEKAYIPSYCCLSMLQYFINYEIKYEFYDINYSKGNFIYNLPDSLKKGEVVLIMSYFGLDRHPVNKIIKDIKKKNVIVIEDITHSLLSKNGYSEESDYLVASLRKWFPVATGGWIGKLNGNLFFKPFLPSEDSIIEKIEGMKDKLDYISGKKNISKEKFLIKNAKFDGELAKASMELKIDSFSLEQIEHQNINFIINRRKSNCRILINGLKNVYDDIEVPEIDLETVTPLFLPIFMDLKKRDSLRSFMIKKGVYCPIHWPEIMGANSGVRENELSLICDQRYNEQDMLYILNCIKEWYHK